jgi:hypothetical protein
MALNITTPLNTSIGVTLPTSYGRISITDNYQGNNVIASIVFYSSKDAYTNNFESCSLKNQNGIIPNILQFEYNRELDGADLLELAHANWIAQLGDWGITATQDLSLSL